MLKFDLKKALLNYEARTGIHLTYEALSSMTGIATDTIKSIATRSNYNATFKAITEISRALNVNPIEYFEWSVDLETN